MADIFSRRDVINLLTNRVVWFLGDSNVRAAYKDLVWLAQENSLTPQRCFKSKLENSFMNDRLTSASKLSRGRDFIEERCYTDNVNRLQIEFMFLTKCFTTRVQSKLDRITTDLHSPDVVVMNSCLWDICRWGPDGVTEYKKNLVKLLKLMKDRLAPWTLVIWLTTPPVSSKIKGAFLIEQLQFMQNSCRFEVLEGNLYAREVVHSFNYDVIDIHFLFLMQIHRRTDDGVHWTPECIRYITNRILTHISLVWKKPLPGNYNSALIARQMSAIANSTANNNNDDVEKVIRHLDKSTKRHTSPISDRTAMSRNQRRRAREKRHNLTELVKRNNQSNHYQPY